MSMAGESETSLPGRAAVEVDRLGAAEWDALVAGFADASLDQTAAWSDARWGVRRNSSIVLKERGAVVAAARLVVVAVPRLPVGIARLKHGPMWRPAAGPPAPGAYAAMLAALAEEYVRRRGLHLTVLPRPSPRATAAEAAALAGAGFACRPETRDPHRYLVAVDPDRGRARAGLGQKWRYNLRKAEAAGLAVGLAEPAEGAEAFARIHAAMVSRKQAAGEDAIGLLPALAALPGSLQPRIVLARHEGAPVAGAVVVPAGDTAYYLYGASDDRALPLNAGYALHWWILGWLAGLGVAWYDLGGEVGAAGLRQFKKGLTGRDGAVLAMPGSFTLCRNPLSRLFAAAAFASRDAAGRLRNRGAAREG